MCTAVTFTDKKSHHYLARTMDFSFELDTRVVSIPKNHVFDSLVSDAVSNQSTRFLLPVRKLKDTGIRLGTDSMKRGLRSHLCILKSMQNTVLRQSTEKQTLPRLTWWRGRLATPKASTNSLKKFQASISLTSSIP